MSSLAIPSSVTAALSALNVHPHGGHGHKKGLDQDSSTDSTSGTAAKVPVGAAQSLFGSAFNALEQLVGLQPPPAAGSPAAASNTAAPANSTAASIAAAGSKINIFA
jgi:hypothetical protein